MTAFNIVGSVKCDDQYLLPKIHSIKYELYESFVSGSLNLANVAPDISGLAGELIERVPKIVAGNIFSDLIGELERDLSDPEVGIGVIDIPEDSSRSCEDSAFWGVALSLAIGSNIFSLGRDRINNTPYTVYAASYRNSKELKGLGLSPIAPEAKLGFHSDGVMINGGVSMPINIMLYNISIEYERPGNFYWIPFAIWSERDSYIERVGVDRPYRIKVTPSVYEADGNRLETVSPQQVIVPIFVPTKSFGTTLYLNGDVMPMQCYSDFDVSVIDDLRHSLSKNRIRFYVPQKQRRLIFVRNVLGVHARDIFEGPNHDALYTRIFLRSVDESAIELVAPGRIQAMRHDK